MNLLTTLLHFADGSPRREEDPITEIFAYILKTHGEIRTAFVEKIRQRICDVTVPKLGDPVIATQVNVPAVDGGTCRYDLVLTWGAPRLEIVVEIKVRAGLTWKRIEDEEGGTTNVHQIERYVALAKRETHAPAPRICPRIEPFPVEVGEEVARVHQYLGCMLWQEVYDLLRATVGRAGRGEGHAHRMPLVEQVLKLMEERHMAAAHFTFDTLTSVSQYIKFRRTLDHVLTQAKDTLIEEGALSCFAKITNKN
jgi:hypothetical protein